jgi:[ribosomal protein S5]-alanine N-acetyltransferase
MEINIIMKNIPIKTPRLSIRDMIPSDIDHIKKIANDTEVMKYLLLWFDEEEQIQNFIVRAKIQAQLDQDERKEFLMTIETAGGNFAGIAIIAADHESETTAEIGYILSKAEWGKGYATETARSLIAYCFQVLQMHKVFGKCDELNTSSARVLEKCGMKYEGTLREHIWLRDHWRSSRFYGILSNEFTENSSV